MQGGWHGPEFNNSQVSGGEFGPPPSTALARRKCKGRREVETERDVQRELYRG